MARRPPPSGHNRRARRTLHIRCHVKGGLQQQQQQQQQQLLPVGRWLIVGPTRSVGAGHEGRQRCCRRRGWRRRHRLPQRATSARRCRRPRLASLVTVRAMQERSRAAETIFVGAAAKRKVPRSLGSIRIVCAASPLVSRRRRPPNRPDPPPMPVLSAGAAPATIDLPRSILPVTLVRFLLLVVALCC
jgi:hypothetical protein